VFLKLNLKKKNIACCLTCYSEAGYVYSSDMRNVFLSFLSLVNIVFFISFVMFAPSAIYFLAAALASTVIALLINGFKHIELRCTQCQKSLIIGKEHQW
jgi:uncharacterized integral membrane protein